MLFSGFNLESRTWSAAIFHCSSTPIARLNTRPCVEQKADYDRVGIGTLRVGNNRERGSALVSTRVSNRTRQSTIGTTPRTAVK